MFICSLDLFTYARYAIEAYRADFDDDYHHHDDYADYMVIVVNRWTEATATQLVPFLGTMGIPGVLI